MRDHFLKENVLRLESHKECSIQTKHKRFHLPLVAEFDMLLRQHQQQPQQQFNSSEPHPPPPDGGDNASAAAGLGEAAAAAAAAAVASNFIGNERANENETDLAWSCVCMPES